MFNPLKLSGKIKDVVCENNKRKYYRWRSAHYYGGIATADCVGCNLRCVFCWAYNIVTKPEKVGEFYSPEEVAKKLIDIADKNNYNKIRISGNEPTIHKEHLLSLLEKIPKNLMFILETNGILIDEDFAKKLSRFSNLHVRVSIKGSSREEFAKFTGASPEFFDYQLRALKNLIGNGVTCHAAVIEISKNINNLENLLNKINKNLDEELEIEPIILYPQVKARLVKAGLM